MTGVTEQVSVSVKTGPRGPNVTTVCQDTTGSKAVTVSMGILTFGGLKKFRVEETLQSFQGLCKCTIHLARAALDVVRSHRGIDHVAH